MIGSGPFMFKKDEWKPGEKVVFVKNPKYKPRPEPMSGLAGGKVVKLDRVEWVWIPDSETQLNALLNGEIDMLESVNYDHLPILEKTKGVKVLTSRTSNQYTFRMNWLQPPFNDVRVRRAAAYALSQPEFLEANIGDKRFYRVCKAMFTCGTPLDIDGRHGGLDRGQRRQGEGAAGRGQVRRRAGGDPAADRSRRHQAARAGRQGAAREGGLQGRGPADGLAEHGEPADHQEGPGRRRAAGAPSAPAGCRSTSSIR